MADKKTQVAKEAATDSKYVSRKRKLYHEEVVPYLMKHFFMVQLSFSANIL